MWEDPIVAEVHRTREKLAAEYNFDITAFFAGLRKRQAALGGRLMYPKNRSAPTAEADPSRATYERALAQVPDVKPEERDRIE